MAMLGVLDWATRELLVHTSRTKRSSDFIDLLSELGRRYDWLTVEWLPKYAPELNDIEDVWRDVKRHHLAHQTFASADDLERGIHHALTDLNRERMHHPLDNQRVSA
jgi:transposase